MPEVTYKRSLNAIHTAVVSRNKQALTNRILGCTPPEVNPIERNLPWQSRWVLNQLRSDFCSCLQSYQALLGNSPDDLCPLCCRASHTTEHLFSCPSTPTNLTVHNLWSKPFEVAEFLRSLPFFTHLPPNTSFPQPPMPPPMAQAPVD
jgi:hypothetical protein